MINNVTHPCLVSILETVPAYPTGSYELEVYGFGARTWAEAEEKAAHEIATFWARRDRTYRAIYREACPTCGVSGVKPGCKRKACPTCQGRGTVPRI